jgi:hypothetical protein
MANYKCKKIIVADGQGGASRTIELGGDVDSGDVTWKHGDVSETPTLEDRAHSMWEIWQPGRNIINSGSSSRYGGIISHTAILSSSPLVYNYDESNRTNVQGSCSFAVGELNYVGTSSSGVIGTNNSLSGSNSSGNNGLIVGEACSADNEIYNFILNGKGLNIQSLNSDSLCILGRYNAYNSSPDSINSINPDTLLVIGKGLNNSNRGNVLRVDTNRIMTSCSDIIFSNLAQGISIFNGDYDKQDLSTTDSIISMTFKHNAFAITKDYATIDQNTQKVVQRRDELTSIQEDKIKTKTIIVDTIKIKQSFGNNTNDSDLKNIFVTKGKSADNILQFSINRFISIDNLGNIIPITTTNQYPIGVFTEYEKDKNNNPITTQPLIATSGLAWVRCIASAPYEIGSFCQIDSLTGKLTSYSNTEESTPYLNKYWVVLDRKSGGDNSEVLINLDQSFSK